MADDTYNGWRNKFTWLVVLWIDNDQGLQESVLDLVEGMDSEKPWIAGEAIETFLDEWREGSNEPRPASMETDMLTTAFGSVDWREVGKHFLEKAADIKANS